DHLARNTRAKSPLKPIEKKEAVDDSKSKGPDLDDPYRVADLETLAALNQGIEPDAADTKSQRVLAKLDQTWLNDFRAELNRIKREMIAPALIQARLAEEAFLNPNSKATGNLCAAVNQLPCGWKDRKSTRLNSSHEWRSY